MTYYDDVCDVESLIEELDTMFPLRVQFGREGKTTSPTGGMIYGDFNLELEGVPATRAKIDATSGKLTLSTGEEALATHVWTLPGDWTQIERHSTLREVKGGRVIGQYKVLSVDLQTHGIHTDLKTQKVA